MKTRISKKVDFDAAHWLPNVPDGHKCKRLHGHTYVLEFTLEGEPKEPDGWFIDYAVIGDVLDQCLSMLDHRCLNEIPGLENPTTENLLAWLWPQVKGALPHLVTMRIWESSTTWCEVSG